MTDDTASLLRFVVSLLSSHEIPHMVVGSFASTVHGEPRSTLDLDIVIDPTPAQLEALIAGFDPDRFYLDADVARDALRRRSMFNVIEIASAWKLDLVIRKDRAFSIEELQRRELLPILGLDVATATAEDTIVAKLEWAKQGASDRQLEDVAGIIRTRGDDLDFEYIERWVTALALEQQWREARAKT
jgi:hypothetical protein